MKGLAAVGPNAKFKANAKQVIISSVQNLEVNVMENPVPSQGITVDTVLFSVNGLDLDIISLRVNILRIL